MQRFWGRFLGDIVAPALVGLFAALLYLQHQKIVGLESSIAALQSAAYTPADPVAATFDATPVTTAASYANAVERAMPAVVNVYTKKRVRRTPIVADPLVQQLLDNSVSPQERIESALGSGVIVSADGYILTNYHVIADAEQILVSLHDGRDAKASLVGTDRETDLAVLKIDLPDLSMIHFGDAQHAKIGDVVLAIGNPVGVGQTVTQGIISAAARYGLELNIQENYLQPDAAINQGNSGGALVDTAGNLVGINTAIQSPTGGSVGIGYAIPSDTARKVLGDILQYGHVIRGWIGIESQALNAFASRALGLQGGQGIVVRSIFRHGPAAQAGLQPGDVITHFDDDPAMATRTGMRRITGAQPGDKIVVRFLRGSQKNTVTLTIGVRPAAQSR
ncbi:MAG: trypsin-like peptidase domain-containing protein [Pseudomonadales bacterium]|nr:trypsin-like peptidase domain-containing protein [Pseudomonadales bacterium]